MNQRNRTMLQLTAIVAMGTVVLVLGILQYRWTSEIGRTEHERLKSVLETSVRDFNQEFSYDFERLGEGFEIDPEEPASTINARVLRQYSSSTRTTPRPQLLGGLYLWRA